MKRAARCRICRGPHERVVHRAAKHGVRRHAPKAGAGKGPKRSWPTAEAMWAFLNKVIDRVGERKLADATAPMKNGGFIPVKPKYAAEFGKALDDGGVSFRTKRIGSSVTFFLDPKQIRGRGRRNPAASPGDSFRVVAHGKNGEVVYRGRELHATYGDAWAEAGRVSRRRDLTDVHVVKNGEAIVGEMKARRNPAQIEWMKCGACNRRVRFTKNLASQRWVADWHPAVGGAGFCAGSRKPAREMSRTNPEPVECNSCGSDLNDEELEDSAEFRYGKLCWGCDFEEHSGISDLDHDRSYGPPVFDGSWRRYDDRRALKAAYRRGTI